MCVNFSKLDSSLIFPVKEVNKILGFVETDDGIVIKAEKQDLIGLKVIIENNTATIYYSSTAFFFRGLGLLKESLNSDKNDVIIEQPSHESLGPMLDCSRNGVLSVDSIKKFVRHLALMGHNMLMLYTEDTYTIDNEPYFGYMRGRYTHDEIREVDNYCKLFGIELIPCIQALAHLGEMLKWPIYDNIRDLSDILLVDEPNTYKFIEECIKTCSGIFTSRNIHLGMDEAWMLGQGKYQQKHGFIPRPKIMRNHLNKVSQICEKYGLKPMMWSDMFFLQDADGNPRDRYDYTTSLPADIYDVPPKNMGLVYWDYYNGDKSTYDGVIEMHRHFKNDIYFAGGAWKWVGFSPLNHYSFTRSIPAALSCFEHKIKKIIITAWGDNGCECPFFAVLPTFQLYAEACFTGSIDYKLISKRFETCVNGILDDFMMLDMPQLPAGNFDNPKDDNPAKYLVYADPLLGLADKHVANGYSNNYKKYSEYLKLAQYRNPNWKYLFNNATALCEFLSHKVDLSLLLKEAYDKNDIAKIKILRNTKLQNAIQSLDAFYETFREQWYTENKTFGYEVIDIRLGGLKSRLLSTLRILDDYIDGHILEIPELKEERLRFDCNNNPDRTDTHLNIWSLIASTNTI